MVCSAILIQKSFKTSETLPLSLMSLPFFSRIMAWLSCAPLLLRKGQTVFQKDLLFTSVPSVFHESKE